MERKLNLRVLGTCHGNIICTALPLTSGKIFDGLNVTALRPFAVNYVTPFEVKAKKFTRKRNPAF